MQHRVWVAGRRRGFREDGVEERTQIGALVIDIELRDAFLAVGIDDREVELVFSSVKIDEQIVDFVEHFGDAGVRAVDFIDDHDLRQPRFQRLAKHVAGLRQRAFARVNQQHDAVNDLQGALDFAAEITVARRVDDVDLDVVIVDAGGLRENRDAALALQIIRVHHALGNFFVLSENPALTEHGVDQGGLSVVYVRKYCDVTNGGVGHLNTWGSPIVARCAGGAVPNTAAEPLAECFSIVHTVVIHLPNRLDIQDKRHA